MPIIEFKVGDTLTVCAAVHEFCGAYQIYFMGTINISKYPDICSITVDPCLTYPPCCLPLSGQQVEFRFTNYDTTILKVIGTRSTDANGVASMAYIITEEDASLFNNNAGFRVMAYLLGSGPNYPDPTSGSRRKTASNLLIRGTYIGNACIMKGAMSVALNDQTLIVYENPTYTAGKITEVCVRKVGSSIILPQGKVKVFRLTGTIWTIVGQSGYQPILNDVPTIFSGLNIIAQKGDYIGLYVAPSTYSAYIDSYGGVGLPYAKIRNGDIVGATDNSEWTTLDIYRISISATIIPCEDVICPDICGIPPDYNLYYGICDPVQGCIRGAVKEYNSPGCGYLPPGEERHFLYFKVSTLFPASYIIDKLNVVYEAANNAILNYITDYYIDAIDFNHETYILTVIIAKRMLVIGPTSPMIYAMVPPIIAVALIMIGLAIVSYILTVFLMQYIGSESVTAEVPSTRTVKVTPTISAIQIIPPTFPIVIEYSIKDTPYTIEITDGTPKTFSIPTNVDVVVTIKAKDNPYYKITKRTVQKCSPQSEDPCAKTCVPICEIVAVFTPAEDGTLNPKAVDSQENPITCGFYDILAQDSEGHLTFIKRKSLGPGGEIEATKVVADVNQCVYIVPCDLDIYRPQLKCYKVGAGETETGDIIVNKCAETKNQVSVRTVYIAVDGTRIEYTADLIEIKLGATTIKTVTPISNITTISGLNKNTTYSVYVTKSGYAMINNGQQVIIGDTDCDMYYVIMEANPPPNTYDIIVEVRSAETANLIQGANVFLDANPALITGAVGTVLFTAVPAGPHHFKIMYNGYITNEFDYNVTTSTTIFKTLTLEQVFATIDTRIINFAASTGLYANSMVKFKGDIEYRDGAEWKKLTEATIKISVKKDDTEIKTFTAISSPGSLIPLISPGYFETTDWLIPTDLANTDISIAAEFEGVGRYKPTIRTAAYHIGAECAIKNPITGECIITPAVGYGFMLLAGLGLLAGILLLSRAVARPAVEKEIRVISPPAPAQIPPTPTSPTPTSPTPTSPTPTSPTPA